MLETQKGLRTYKSSPSDGVYDGVRGRYLGQMASPPEIVLHAAEALPEPRPLPARPDTENWFDGPTPWERAQALLSSDEAAKPDSSRNRNIKRKVLIVAAVGAAVVGFIYAQAKYGPNEKAPYKTGAAIPTATSGTV